MKGVCFQGIERVGVQQLPDPVIEHARDAIVRVELAGLCGSDLHPFYGREQGIESGTVMGHEFVGQVVELGETVSDLNVGDRVCAPFTTNCGECYYCKCGLTSRCTRSELFVVARTWQRFAWWPGDAGACSSCRCNLDEDTEWNLR